VYIHLKNKFSKLYNALLKSKSKIKCVKKHNRDLIYGKLLKLKNSLK
jgi:hypothetical protein